MTADEKLRRAQNDQTMRREGLAARSEPRAEGLREAVAQALVAYNGGKRAYWTFPFTIEQARDLAADLLPDLAATPPAEGLDVERLREAIRRSVDVTTRERVTPYLDSIAREYAALAPEQPE